MNRIKGYLLLEGGAEFGGRMADADRRAIELAGGNRCRIDIIPAAAAPDNNHHNAGRNGVRWFTGLGANHVVSQLLIDNNSAQDSQIAEVLQKSHLLFLLGGFPGYLAHVLAGSLCWQSMVAAYMNGAVLGGSSAGAMVLADHYYDPESELVNPGLGLLHNVCVIPHYRRVAASWSERLRRLLPDVLILGIDEETGIINDLPAGGWTVYGRGDVYLCRPGQSQIFHSGELITYATLPPPHI